MLCLVWKREICFFFWSNALPTLHVIVSYAQKGTQMEWETIQNNLKLFAEFDSMVAFNFNNSGNNQTIKVWYVWLHISSHARNAYAALTSWFITIRVKNVCVLLNL